jgi:hypothetical protein
MAKLDSMGFAWSVKHWSTAESSTSTPRWNEMFQKLEEYRHENGDCLVHSTHEDKSLSNWVRSQRTLHFSNKLHPDRKAKLDSIGFIWDVKSSSSSLSSRQEWNDMFVKLEEYKRTFGDCLVPSRYDDKTLANWVRTQRTHCHANKLPMDQRTKLDSIGFAWTLGKSLPNQSI